MTAEKPLIIVTRKLPQPVETRMRELFNVQFNDDDKPMTKEELIRAVQTASILIPTVTDRIDRAVLSQSGPDLKLIANFGTGVDNIDIDTARNRGVIVTNTPGVLTEDTADMTMALILAVPRRLAEGARLLKANADSWRGWSPTWMLGHRIYGKKLGIIAWAVSGRRLHGAPALLDSISITTTGVMFRPRSRPNLGQPIGKASIKCSPMSISYR